MNNFNVTIIGAGPYGLSIAAHAASLGIEHRVFGDPMGYWRHHMPKGMMLKSEGDASNLYDPDRFFSLERYCREHAIHYAPMGLPVALKDFVAYGLAFQERYAPNVQNRKLVKLEQAPNGFLLALEDGEALSARSVVLATGLSYFSRIPEELAGLAPEFLTHSSEHSDLARFKDRHVTVIGAGASAVDIATLLHEGGADVLLVARTPRIETADKMRLPRPLSDRIRWPMSGIGPSWRSLFYAEAPNLFHALPENIRLPRAKRYLGPAGGYFMRERFNKVPQLSGYQTRRVEIVNGRARLTFAGHDGSKHHISTDHVIAATGFRVDLRRLPFLDSSLRAQIKSVEHTPVLSQDFQSSVRGLYFVGPVSTNSFGPVMRFAFGAKFTAARVARSLANASGQWARVKEGGL